MAARVGEDALSQRIRREALQVESDEPALSGLLRATVLAPSVHSFEQAVAADATLTDKLGATLPEWARVHEVLRERLQARL